MKRFLIALQFLTIIPVRKGINVSEAEIAKSSSVFVLVGIIQGILLIATDYIAGRVFHPDLVTGIILLVYVLSTGGFHLDGLADTFDAIAAKAEGSPDADQQNVSPY
jgi:adenosylcobinamide-GDP ribazoletransferase